MESHLTPEILIRHGRFVRSLSERLLRDAHLAEDVAQEVWVQWARHGARVERPESWLRTAVRHAATNLLRRRARRLQHEALGAPLERSVTPEAQGEQAELVRSISETVFALEEPLRSTILARYVQGRSARELARDEGLSVATVRSRERRALERLRERLDRDFGERRTWALGLAGLLRPVRLASGSPGLVVAKAVALMAALLGAGWVLWPSNERVERTRHRGEAALATPSEAARATRELVAADDEPAPDRRATVAGAESVPVASAPVSRGATRVGRTVEPSGAAVAGATVRLFQRGTAVPEIVVSDAEGHFRFETVDVRRIEAACTGFAFLGASNSSAAAADASERLSVVLAPLASVLLTVLDASNRPLADIDVTLRVESSDRVEPWRGGSLQRADVERKSRTTAAGTVRFDDVWAGVKLEFGFEARGPGVAIAYTTARRDGRRLVLDTTRSGQPIVAAHGEVLELESHWLGDVRLRGRLVSSDGRPPVDSTLRVTDLGRDARDWTRGLLPRESVAGEHFDVSFRTPWIAGPLLLEAWSGSHSDESFTSPDGSSSVSVTPLALRGRLELEAERWRSDDELVIELAPAAERTIGIQLIASDRAPIFDGYAAHAFQGASDPLARASYGITSAFLGGGPLLLMGLRDGAFDLAVALDEPDPRAGRYLRFSDVPVGSGVTEQRLPGSCDVRVRLQVQRVEGAHWSSLTHVRFPRDPVGAERNLASERQLVTGGAWPAGVRRTASTPARESKTGWTLAHVDAVPMGEHAVDLAVGSAGWYAFGALAFDDDGELRASACSALAYYPPGTYTIEFELPETGSLRGRVVTDGTSEFLGISLFDARGRALALPVLDPKAPPETVLPLSTAGYFRLDEVPVGVWRIAVGRIADLQAGKVLRERRIEVHAGPNPTLELRM